MARMKRPAWPIPQYGDGTYLVPKLKSKTGHWYLCRVQSGDSFVTLARLDGWSNVWELIEANFRTRDPEEINWYLKHYVGCTAKSPDGQNFEFSSTDSPGLIYTQHIVYRKGKPPIIKLLHLIESVLSDAKIKWVNFSIFGGYRIQPSLFRDVRDCIRNGWIQVLHAPKLSADGEYTAATNRFRVRTTANSAENAGLIVHEAVHAGFDFRTIFGPRSINKAYSEAMAYLAQALFYHWKTGNHLAGSPSEGTIFDRANDIVIEIVDRQLRGVLKPGEAYQVPKRMAEALANAVNASPRYAGSLAKRSHYDGIEDPRLF